MTRRDPHKHHRRSIRLKDYDYSQAGMYFITIVTRGRECTFGEIIDGETRLSAWGNIVQQEWIRLSKRFPYLELDAFVVMPNHLHGIITIIENCSRGTGTNAVDSRKLTTPRAPTAERFGQPVVGSIPTIVRSYKSSVTQRIMGTMGGSRNTVWQRNYYERVVRNEDELNRMRQYIQDNPLNWETDRENPLQL